MRNFLLATGLGLSLLIGGSHAHVEAKQTFCQAAANGLSTQTNDDAAIYRLYSLGCDNRGTTWVEAGGNNCEIYAYNYASSDANPSVEQVISKTKSKGCLHFEDGSYSQK